MSVVEVIAECGLLMFVHQIWVGAVCSYSHSQQAVYYNICIPAQEWSGGLDVNKRGNNELRQDVVVLVRCI